MWLNGLECRKPFNLAYLKLELYLALLSGFSNHHFSVQHLLRVIPVIGILRDKKAFKPIPNPAEVDEVFDAPLEMFIKVFLSTLSTFSAFVYITIII